MGRQREEEWEKLLIEEGFQQIDSLKQKSSKDNSDSEEKEIRWDEFRKSLQKSLKKQKIFAREVSIEGRVGNFVVSGKADFILLMWNGNIPILRIVECKASRKDKTHHRIQVALYKILIEQLISENSLSIDGKKIDLSKIECVVGRIDESTNKIQNILSLKPLNLSQEIDDIYQLLSEDGPFNQISDSPLEELEYQLESKCDHCVFNVHCFPESARQRKLELLGIDPSTIRILKKQKISTIDKLAELKGDGPEASDIRKNPDFNENLDALIRNAKARRKTLPGGKDFDSYEVEKLPNKVSSQLPLHDIDEKRLVRVYLSVDYDYVENRVGALSAHVTTSPGYITTDFKKNGDQFIPDPEVKEVIKDNEGKKVTTQQVVGKDVVEFISSEWSGIYETDSGIERQLIQGFFQKLVDAIAEVAVSEKAPIHFYVWSRSEMSQLIEACSRVSTKLLSSLRELLGCRESLDQLIFSCLKDEVNNRFALGWTGRGLAVVSSLKWYGQKYHWKRKVAGADIDLDKAFTQDIFDFKTTLALQLEENQWAPSNDDSIGLYRFEIRSRFNDTLTAPYWRAYWRTLDRLEVKNQRTKNSIKRYKEAAKPGYLREYLKARVQAIRWIEEKITPKNKDIEKPLLKIANLPNFTLGVDSTAQAGIDFLRLDHHIKVTDWIAANMIAPIERIHSGRTLPLREVVLTKDKRISAKIDSRGFGPELSFFESRSTITENSFVRINPFFGDPHQGQFLFQLTKQGITCSVLSINWNNGEIVLDPLWNSPSRYILKSNYSSKETKIFDHATLDENVSDFVAKKVEERLGTNLGNYVYRWFDPEKPQIPEKESLSKQQRKQYKDILSSFKTNGVELADSQVEAILDGLDTTIHLLQGPPGTGKTLTTAIAVLTKLIGKKEGEIILLAANTHTAIDNLLERIKKYEPAFREHIKKYDLSLPNISINKVYSSKSNKDNELPIVESIFANTCKAKIKKIKQNSTALIGGTTSAILKMAKNLSEAKDYKEAVHKFLADSLVVDEASMMVFPHFLALATLIKEDGDLLLAGDHRQLSPIIAHDWEKEDRPPVVTYQPFVSAYQAVLNISITDKVTEQSIRRTALDFTFRLAPLIRDLIGRLYKKDHIELDGLSRDSEIPSENGKDVWQNIWNAETGLFLVLHNEKSSRQSNHFEVQLIKKLLEKGGKLAENSVAIITPHRAQRNLLKKELADFEKIIKVIDTVERLQGGECSTVIVSATASDPSAIGKNASFILDLNRSNVAFSRAQDRLIVISSDSLLNHIPSELDNYDSAMLWKSLRNICSKRLAKSSFEKQTIKLMTPVVD